MSDLYDVYKEEALRLLMNEKMLVDSVRHHIGSLRASFVPAVKIDAITTNHYRTWERFVITIAGSCSVIQNTPFTQDQIARRQRHWVVCKLRDFGGILGCATTRVASRSGTVYFSYHMVVKMDSHLADS
jgi:hypothetical protein